MEHESRTGASSGLEDPVSRALRGEHEQWLDDWEGAREALQRFDADQARYADEVLRRRAELSGAQHQPFHGWWNRDFPSFSARLDHIREELLTITSGASGQRLPVLVAPWPGRGLHARTASAQEGFIILVNTLALPLLQTVAWILAGSAQRLFPRAARWTDDPLEPAATQRFLALCVKAALDPEEPHVVPPDEWTGARANIQELLTHGALEFMVAHEMAHILGGHFDDPTNRTLLDVQFEPATESAVLWNMRLEMDADASGMELLDAYWLDRIGQTGRLRGALAAPFVLLGFQLLVDQTRAALWDDWGETHPSAFMRGAILMNRLRERLPDSLLDEAESIAEWFWNEHEGIVAQVTGEAQ
jgi:hypothetical protein